ncbi:hypothetical protein ABZ135_20165 [Streptomyces sp. NPDC006339]|uniref:hypothetical protein n=1 Tax=Streptomyces sp. NPDC006339 TaxID=3156755 RepID=UPI0033AED67C
MALALLGGLAAWFVLGRDSAPACNGLPENKRVQQSLGAGVKPGMSCAALGEVIVEATTGSKPGVHSRQQAQALKDVLFELGSTQPEDLTIDPALRLPLATALADYAPDVHELLVTLDSKYILEGDRTKPPWESEGTYHLAVYNTMFRHIVRAVSEDPEAYALLRTAETRQVANGLAAVPRDAKDAAFSLPATKGARALGVLDGIATVVLQGLDEDEAKAWRVTVVKGVARGLDAPVEGKDQAGEAFAAVWLQEFEKTPEAERFDRLSTQGVDLTRIWLKSRNTDETAQQALLGEVESSALGGAREVTH